MSEMVERVARVICDTQAACGALPRAAKGDPRSDWAYGPALLVARSAVAAMREPTEAMIEYGMIWNYPTATWQAMIDAALSDT